MSHKIYICIQTKIHQDTNRNQPYQEFHALHTLSQALSSTQRDTGYRYCNWDTRYTARCWEPSGSVGCRVHCARRLDTKPQCDLPLSASHGQCRQLIDCLACQRLTVHPSCSGMLTRDTADFIKLMYVVGIWKNTVLLR